MKCALAEKGCGGCENLHRMYGDLLTEKQETFRRLFPECETIVGAENPCYYRNKVLRTFANGRESLFAGFYRGGTHQILSVKRCLLENKRLGQIADIAVSLLAEMQLSAYREDFGRGILRHMQLRIAPRSGQVLVTIITGGESFPGGAEFAQKLMGKCPEVSGVTHCVNERRTNAVMGFKHKVLAGRDEIWDTLCGLKVCLTSRAFYQINSPQAEKMYRRAVEWAELTKEDHVLDAYCGVGLIGQIAAGEAGRVTGVEIVKPSVECAQKSARVNCIKNIDFICADAPKALEGGKVKPTVILVDPPRAGCDKKFLEAAVHAAPRSIVYISCNPETLRRDVDYLEKHGYVLERVQPYDLFPYTPHTEAVALLRKNKK
ncbi:MAG: 23S rRNA (uracil(1939)-C(5))-methyltransferase RlmD [Clostridia bacterium]|nr:23S rRNA (uracil(1939)-C(5))-methyltransferase RlmD [Clostridia bacterium]